MPSLSRDCHCEWVTAYDWAYLNVAHKLFKKSRLITPSIRLSTWLPRHLYHKRALEAEKEKQEATVQLLTRHWCTSRHWGIFLWWGRDERAGLVSCLPREVIAVASVIANRKKRTPSKIPNYSKRVQVATKYIKLMSAIRVENKVTQLRKL